MKTDEIMYSLKHIIGRKTRSWLSVVSILIGITAIFTLVSFGLGIQNYMNTLAVEMGADKIFIMAKGTGAPGMDENFFITKEEMDFVSKIKGVDEITGMYFKAGEIEFNKERIYNFVIGLEAEKIDFINEGFTIEIDKGRALKEGDLDKVFLGYNYQIGDKAMVFKNPVDLGDKVEIKEESFEVIGFYDEVGNPSDDAQIYLSFDAFEKLYPDVKDKFGYVILRSAKGVDPNALADKIEEKLRKHKGQEEGEEDFYVQTLVDMMEIYGTVINVLTSILVLIALISLIVASVNIMNTMYAAVLERTQEIGVMKAIGARNEDIRFIFIFESGFLGLVGGILGVIFGYLISRLGGYIAVVSGYSILQPIFPWYLTAGCLLFAFSVGAIAGLLPASNASKQKPADALRYE